MAVVASNIHWRWTPNGYLASLLGVAAALIVTIALSKLQSLLLRLNLWPVRRQRGLDQSSSTRIEPL